MDEASLRITINPDELELYRRAKKVVKEEYGAELDCGEQSYFCEPGEELGRRFRAVVDAVDPEKIQTDDDTDFEAEEPGEKVDPCDSGTELDKLAIGSKARKACMVRRLRRKNAVRMAAKKAAINSDAKTPGKRRALLGERIDELEMEIDSCFEFERVHVQRFERNPTDKRSVIEIIRMRAIVIELEKDLEEARREYKKTKVRKRAALPSAHEGDNAVKKIKTSKDE